MSRFLKRLVGNYEQEELLITIQGFQLKIDSPAPFDNLCLEFKRGDRTDKSTSLVNIDEGEGEYPITCTYNKLSVFYCN
jgi:hypothetical protein